MTYLLPLVGFGLLGLEGLLLMVVFVLIQELNKPHSRVGAHHFLMFFALGVTVGGGLTALSVIIQRIAASAH